MPQMMGWRAAAKIVGLAEGELFNGLRTGRYPGLKCGARRPRWIVDVEKLQARIDELMEANVRGEQEQPVGGIRRVK